MLVTGLKRLYRWAQAMSLDVVLGSGLLSLAISRCYQVKLPLVVVLCLMIAVWLIYTYDHLSDARKVKKAAATYRHRFHQRHYRLLCISLVPVAFAGLFLLFYLPFITLKWGLFCAGLVAFYFLMLRLGLFWFKEFFVAICYTLGVFLGPLSLAEPSPALYEWLLLPQVLLLALANLVIFSCFDYHSDRRDGHSSLALHLGPVLARKIAIGLLALGLLSNILLMLLTHFLPLANLQLLFMLMNLLLLMLLYREQTFRQNERYRIIGDGVFFLPALMLLYAG